MAAVWKHVPRVGRKVARIVPIKERKFLRLALVRDGCVNRPFYTLHVKYNTEECKQTGIEQIGSWDPFPNKWGEQLVAVNIDRLSYWLSKGAQPTETVCQLLGLGGLLPVHPRSYLMSHRYRTKGTTDHRIIEEGSNDKEGVNEEDGDKPKGLPWRLDLR